MELGVGSWRNVAISLIDCGSMSVNAWLQQLSPQGSRDVKKPSRHPNGLAIAPGHLTKGPASLRGWLVANRFYSPVPVSFTVCGLLLAVSFTFKVAVRVPVACGVNFTERVHLPLAATVVPQVLVWAKSLGSVPVKVMLLMVNAVDRLLVNVTVLAALVVLTGCAAKVSEVGDQAT